MESPRTPPVEDAQLVTLTRELAPELELVRPLGEGQMATVHLAKDTALGRMVAVKVLRPEAASDETTRRRFDREARSAASFSHANVVSVHSVGRLSDETPYMVMQYVKGRSMAERLKAEGRLRLELACTVLHDVASALTAAHSRGIIHRDLRPENVLWDDERDRALLTDFGIATIADANSSEVTRLTNVGELIGNPRYLSPEQLRDEELTPQADIYSFGVLAYELLTGEGPFAAKSKVEWITAHLTMEPRDLLALRPECDPALGDLLRRCLTKEPRHRPSAADVVGALEEMAGRGQSGAAPSGGLAASDGGTGLLRKRMPQIVLVTAGVGYAVLQGVGLLTEQGIMPSITFRLTLIAVVAGVLASAVVAWFHGEKGRQKAPKVEYAILGAIALAWLAVSAWVLGRG